MKESPMLNSNTEAPPRSGPYLKGLTKRREILEIALELIAENGYANINLQQIADAAKITKAGLLYHFGSKENLLTEVLRRRDERDSATFTSAEMTEPRITRVVRHNSEVPGLVELYSALLQEGIAPGHPAHDFFIQRYGRVTGNVADDVRRGIEMGSLRPGLKPELLSRILVAVSDGLQQQWQYDRSIDMADHLDYLWSLLGADGSAGTSSMQCEVGAE